MKWQTVKLLNCLIISSTGIPVMYCLLEVVSVFPEKLASRFVEKIDWIKVSFVFQVSQHINSTVGSCWLFSDLSLLLSVRIDVVFISELVFCFPESNEHKQRGHEGAGSSAVCLGDLHHDWQWAAVGRSEPHQNQQRQPCKHLENSTPSFISPFHFQVKYFFVTSRARRRSTVPSWLWATWWEGTWAGRNLSFRVTLHTAKGSSWSCPPLRTTNSFQRPPRQLVWKF